MNEKYDPTTLLSPYHHALVVYSPVDCRNKTQVNKKEKFRETCRKKKKLEHAHAENQKPGGRITESSLPPEGGIRSKPFLKSNFPRVRWNG